MDHIESNQILQVEDLEIGYKGNSMNYGKSGEECRVAGPLALDLPKGMLVSLIGPNGSGKSTLLRTMAGLHPALRGEIKVNGQDLSQMHASEVARNLSVVLTDRVQPGNLTAYALVALGRYPYTGWLGKLSRKDHDVIKYAIEITGASHLANRNVNLLSDGERQKIMLARALAQDTNLIILDEPTAHLDLPNRVEIIRILRELAAKTGKSIIMSTHELDLALQVSDRLWLMTGKHDVSAMITGVPEDLVLNGRIGEVFAKKGVYFDKKTGGFKVNKRASSTISVSGENTLVFWTSRALERLGFEVTCEKMKNIHVEVYFREDAPEQPEWHLTLQKQDHKLSSVQALCDKILGKDKAGAQGLKGVRSFGQSGSEGNYNGLSKYQTGKADKGSGNPDNKYYQHPGMKSF